ncbi:MAG: GAF domain-containing protein [Aggregatilineales bacterium]
MTDVQQDQPKMSEAKPNEETLMNTPKNGEIERLYSIQRITAKLGALASFSDLKTQLLKEVSALFEQRRILLFLLNDEKIGLNFAGISQPLDDDEAEERLLNSTIKIFNSDDETVKKLIENTAVALDNITTTDTPFSDLASLLNIDHLYLLPLLFKETLIGLIVLEVNPQTPLNDTDKRILAVLATNLAVSLNNKRTQEGTVQQLAAKMNEMSILQQIDQELNDTIELSTVFNMTCDWALRFSNANAASIALYEEDNDTLRTMFNYGYSITDEEIESLRGQTKSSIAYRVARTGRAEVVPDVSIDMDYQPVEQNIISQMSVPVLREEQVIAVLTLESKKLNAYTDDHLSFVKNLANRAAVAIDNARLYTESERERNKVSHILRNIVDIVIVISPEGRIVLMNQSAISALRLYSDTDYIGRIFDEAIDFRPLINIYHKARDTNEPLTEEITMPNNRVFYTKAELHEGVGWLIVMQDVTPYERDGSPQE